MSRCKKKANMTESIAFGASREQLIHYVNIFFVIPVVLPVVSCFLKQNSICKYIFFLISRSFPLFVSVLCAAR